ncbi:MAG: T9SS type A sorting domain-containing protein [Ignavibacteriae bacterium]|nr:T9SS type A sorting domain-containing protein [Ignavibacteriota bacterium]
MKNINIIIAAIVITLTSQLSFGQWVPVNTLSLDSYPVVSMASNSIVFVAGSQKTQNDKGVVYKSTDGGTTFSSLNINPPTRKLYCINARSENELYIGEGGVRLTSEGQVKAYRSTNGGQTWNSIITTVDRGFFNWILFSKTNPNFGVIMSDAKNIGNNSDFSMWKTTNNGTTWTAFTVPSQKSTSYMNSGYLIDNNFYGFGMQEKTGIMMTKNGGANWIFSDLSAISTKGVSSVSFNDDKLNGIASFLNDNVVARTTNGGTNWFSQSVSPSNAMITGTGSVDYVSGTNAVYLMVSNTTGTQSYKSVDNGATWESIPVPSQVKDVYSFDIYYNGVSNATGFGTSSTTAPIKLIDSSPLPVKLQSFTYSVSGRNVNLNWATSMEENNAGFDIERKSETGNWTKVGFVAGKGNSNNVNNYTYTDSKIESGKFSYRLKQSDYNGNFEYFTLSGNVTVGTPSKYVLSQNYPNPFNPVTKIDFEIPQDAKVTMKVYDITGKEMSTLFSGVKSAGFHTVQFDGNGLSTGIYFYRLVASANGQETVITKKMNLIK